MTTPNKEKDSLSNKREPLHGSQLTDVVQETYSWMGKTWVFVRKARVTTWQGVFLLAFISGTFVAFVWSVSLEIQTLSKASGQAALSLVPSANNVNPNDTFDVDIVADTAGSDVVAVRAIVTYNTADFQLTNWDTSNSIFSVNNTCVYQGNPCQIVDNNTSSGSISITMAKPSPGVKSDSGIVATLTFRALQNVTATQNNIRITFTGADHFDDSDVIADDGLGTDLLSSVTGALVLVGAPLCTDYTYDNWTTCQSNGTQTRNVISGIPDGCAGGVTPQTTQSCTYVPPTCTSYNTGNWNTCQPDGTQSRTVTGVPSGCTPDGNEPNSTQTCTYTGSGQACSSYNTGNWNTCQPDGTQSRTVTGVPSGCAPDGSEPSSTQNCDYVPPVISCTSFDYSDWGSCIAGTQSRSVTGSPSGCSGGNPESAERSCSVSAGNSSNVLIGSDHRIRVVGEKQKFEKSETFYSNSRKVTFEGTETAIARGKVEVYRDDKYKESDSVGSDGKWEVSIKEKDDGKHKYYIRYLDSNGNEVETSAKYKVVIDTDDPDITDLPLFLNKSRGEKVWWSAKDDDEIDYYRYEFLGRIERTTHKWFNIPANTPPGFHGFKLKVYDRAGNITSKTIIVRVR